LQASQRKALDAQIKDHEDKRRAEEAEIIKEKKIVQAEVGQRLLYFSYFLPS